MKLTGLHLLITYQCTLECDHCFAWGSPWQLATMTLADVRFILDQATDLGSVEWIYFEGGEPFLFYGTLTRAIEAANQAGFRVGLVSNGYWATTQEDARVWLAPLAGMVADLSLSSDSYHNLEDMETRVANAQQAAEQLGIPCGIIRIAEPEAIDASLAKGQLPAGESALIYRGRAVEKLVSRGPRKPWAELNLCPYEDLRDPGRVHVDPLGFVHICQGIAMGNLFETPLVEICSQYQPESHPITGPLLAGGPAELARRNGITPADGYADGCHFCYRTRQVLRTRFPEILAPDPIYGIF